MKLRPYQEIIVDHILDNKRCNVFVPMGLGKTLATLASLDILSLSDDSKTLVIAPKRVAQSTWPDEVKKWNFEGSIIPIIGNAKEREKALRQDAQIYTTNYENIPWLIEWFKYSTKPWPFGTVVADEVTKLKGFRINQGTKRSKALAGVAHKSITKWVGLTGTPAPNGLKDLWGPMWFVDGGKRLGKSYTAFTDRWFVTGRDGFSLVPMAHAEKEIQHLISDVCLSLDAGDYFDLKEPIINKIVVELPTKAMQLYKDMEKRMFLELEGKLGPTEVEAVNAAARTQKCLQLANGAIYTDMSKNWQETHDVKIQALDEIIEEANGEPVLVAYHFKHDLARLKSAFPSGHVFDDNPETLTRWNKGKIPILFIHPASGGHGLNLQDGGNILAFFSVNWSLEEHQQVMERIGSIRQAQSGYDRPIFIHYILANGTIDFDVVERLEGKATVQEALMQALRRSKKH